MLQRVHTLIVAGGLIALTIALAPSSHSIAQDAPHAQEAPKTSEVAPAPVADQPPAEKPAMRTAVENPKALSDHVTRGLDWLANHQLEDGGWGQGEESAHMGHGMEALAEKSNVADTCAALLAFIRAGGSPSQGPWSTHLNRGLEFVFTQIEQADADSLSITTVNGTRVQSKLGSYIDTFLASLVLAELKGKMPNDEAEQRLAVATRKVLHKIEKNQKNGAWENPGWAPVLAQSIASKGMNRAAQSGVFVAAPALDMSARAAQKEVQGAGGGFAAEGAAGIALYSGAANVATLQDSVNTNEQRRDELEEKAKNAADPQERENAQRELNRIDDVKAACETMHENILKRLDEPDFIAGFGSNGGEEFISYMNIGEALVVTGGERWKTWDAEISANMNRIQNNDGSWSGHHCITGRTFCTATALLVLMVDRTPVPVEAVKKAE